MGLGYGVRVRLLVPLGELSERDGPVALVPIGPRPEKRQGRLLLGERTREYGGVARNVVPGKGKG